MHGFKANQSTFLGLQSWNPAIIGSPTANMSPPESKAAVVAERRQERQQKSTIRYPFWFGGSASSMAACVTHPLDLGMIL